MLGYLVAVLAASFLEHGIYAYVWLKPKHFIRTLSRGYDPVERVHELLVLCKVLQFVPLGAAIAFHALLPANVLVSAFWCVVFACGQILNTAVFRAIGKQGVYYGIKLKPEVKIPWCTDFPYNVPWLKHPQYIGASSSYLAVYFLFLASAAPAATTAIFVCGIALSYIFIAYIEQCT